jgi:ArsR family transcriptional regulator
MRMSTLDPKQAVYACLAEIGQAIGNPNRLELLEHMSQGPRSVEELAARAGLSFANTSRHLQILRRARLVEAARRGKNVIYSLSGEAQVLGLLKALGCVGARNVAEIRQMMADYFGARDALAPVTRVELMVSLREGTVTLLDVRPEDEFALGHLPGALNMPLDELERRLRELPRDRAIVAYCRGPYCVLAFEAVARLRAKGFSVRRLEDGFPEWKAAGLAVEVAA